MSSRRGSAAGQRGASLGSDNTQRPTSTSSASRFQHGTSGGHTSARASGTSTSGNHTSARTAGTSTNASTQQRSTRHSQSRPSTSRRAGSTRPGTGRSTLADLEVEGTWVCAVFEGRGAAAATSVGIAAYEQETGLVVLTEFSDTQTYVRVVHHLALHPPCAILVPDSSVARASAQGQPSVLVQCIVEALNLDVVPTKKSHWEPQEGASYLDRLLSDSSHADLEADGLLQGQTATATATTRESILVALGDKYLALCATCALFKNLEAANDRAFLSRSLKIQYMPPEGTILIDPVSVVQLELLPRVGDRGAMGTLFGLLNHCRTPMATRMLKMNLVQPLTSTETISARLDAVEELFEETDRHNAIRKALETVGRSRIDLDKSVAGLLNVDRSGARAQLHNPNITETKLRHLLGLKHFLTVVGPVRMALAGAQSPVLRAVEKFLSAEELDHLLEELTACLNQDLTNGKGGIEQLNAKIFAVKANHTPLLDIARTTYRENSEEIVQLAETLTEAHGLPLKLKYTPAGYILELKAEHVPSGLAGRGFVNITRTQRGTAFTLSTLELKKLNRRLKDSLDEVLLLSDRVINDLCWQLTDDVGTLYRVSEAIALLDLLSSFAEVARREKYVRPEFTDVLDIRAGRHPVLHSSPAGPAVPNDAFADECSFFSVITGPNMSGKTTYLKQVALLSIMASIGCFVPAESASFRPCGAILTRLSNDDDMEHNLSTFAAEMRSAASMLPLALASPGRCLVLLDELGRGTSPQEGLGIAHAISERLLDSRAAIFFATHYTELAATLSAYPGVSLRNLLVDVRVGVGASASAASADEPRGRNRNRNAEMRYQYKLVDGSVQGTGPAAQYGLRLAACGSALPDALLERAFEVSCELQTLCDTGRSGTAGAEHAPIPVRCLLQYDRALRYLLEQARTGRDFAGSTGAQDLLKALAALQRDLVADLSEEAGLFEGCEDGEERGEEEDGERA